MIVDADEVLTLWTIDARRRGYVPTVFPDGPRVGQLAERYLDGSGTPRYAAAPFEVEQVHQAVLARERGDIAAWESLRGSALGVAAQWVSRLPQAVIDAAKSTGKAAAGIVVVVLLGWWMLNSRRKN